MPPTGVQQGGKLFRIPHRSALLFLLEHIDLPHEPIYDFRTAFVALQVVLERCDDLVPLFGRELSPGSPDISLLQLYSELQKEGDCAILASADPRHERIVRIFEELVNGSRLAGEIPNVLHRLHQTRPGCLSDQIPVQTFQTPGPLILQVTYGSEYCQMYEVHILPVHGKCDEECRTCSTQFGGP